jgi:hypothetical protein
MNRIPLLISVTGALVAGSYAGATDWKAQSLSSKRQTVSQVIDCMKRRMSSDRAISYNEAAKVCKQQVLAQQNEGPRTVPLVAADTSATR